jgi:peptidoglycan/LPS O-acetylase OafA/YrhL
MGSNAPTPYVRDLAPNITALDGIRGLALLQVLLAHTHYILNSDPFAVNVTRWTLVNRIFEPGYLGLDIFFTLSGFLITSLLLRDLALWRRGAESGPSILRRFYARRALRLLPALYVMLAASWIWVFVTDDVSHDAQWGSTFSAVLYIANWAIVWGSPATNPDLGHLWSLAVEEQFYIVWPIVLLLLVRLCKSHTIKIVLIAAIALLVMWHRTNIHGDGANWLATYIRTDTRVDSMLIGALFAIVYRHVRMDRRFVSIAAWICLAGIMFYKFGPPPADRFTIGFTRTSIFAGFCLLAAASGTWSFNKVLTWRPLTALGRYSYGLYLYHHVVFLGVGRHMPQYSQSIRLIVAYGLSALFTFLSWRYVEARCLKLKSRFETRR